MYTPSIKTNREKERFNGQCQVLLQQAVQLLLPTYLLRLSQRLTMKGVAELLRQRRVLRNRLDHSKQLVHLPQRDIEGIDAAHPFPQQ